MEKLVLGLLLMQLSNKPMRQKEVQLGLPRVDHQSLCLQNVRAQILLQWISFQLCLREEHP